MGFNIAQQVTSSTTLSTTVNALVAWTVNIISSVMESCLMSQLLAIFTQLTIRDGLSSLRKKVAVFVVIVAMDVEFWDRTGLQVLFMWGNIRLMGRCMINGLKMEIWAIIISMLPEMKIGHPKDCIWNMHGLPNILALLTKENFLIVYMHYRLIVTPKNRLAVLYRRFAANSEGNRRHNDPKC